MKPHKLHNKLNLNVSDVFIHIFGFDNAVFLTIAQQYYLSSKEKDMSFKMPFKDVQKRFQMTRHKQDKCREYFSNHCILCVEDAKFHVQDGKTYSFDLNAISTLNYILGMAESVKNYKDKIPKKMIRENLDINAIVEKLEKITNW